MPTPHYKCPKCGNEDSLDVAALIWVRLRQTEDNLETSVEEAHDHAHDWDKNSVMYCDACEHCASVPEFYRD